MPLALLAGAALTTVAYAQVPSSNAADGDRSSIAKPISPRLPFEVVHPTNVDALRARMADRSDDVSLEGDILTITHRDTRDVVVLNGSLQNPMTRIAESDIWYLQLKRPDWDRAFFSYIFAEARATTLETAPMLEYRGRNAPALQRAASLTGRILVRTISSKHLNEDRAVSVYLPPRRQQSLPVLFMTDGAFLDRFARVVEPLIVAGRIEPIAIVGVHASTRPGTRPGIDERSQEYVAMVTPQTFVRHLRFFIEEVVPTMTREFQLSSRREDRALFGFSNGAAFASAAVARHPDVFAYALPFSFNLPRIESAKELGPAYFFAAGELEPHFLATTRNAHERLAESGTRSSLRVYMSGHDLMMWQLALSEYLPEIFNSR